MSEYIVNLEGELGMALAVACAGAGFAREEIVRCRDCKYYDDYTGCCTRRDNVAPMAVTPDGFCAWAERREP